MERLAALSRLTLGPREAERLRGELSSILEYFATLDRVDVSEAPLAVEASKDQGTRDDVVRPSSPEVILPGVPQRKGRYVRAPRVF